MQRMKAVLFGGAIVAAILGGPGVATVSAVPAPSVTATYQGWTCHTDGSGTVSPTTTQSAAVIWSTPARDTIGCTFADYGSPSAPMSITFGGECYFNVPAGPTIEFSHRVFVVANGTASLACWGGSVEPV
jgi:hypothetical protein